MLDDVRKSSTFKLNPSFSAVPRPRPAGRPLMSSPAGSIQMRPAQTGVSVYQLRTPAGLAEIRSRLAAAVCRRNYNDPRLHRHRRRPPPNPAAAALSPAQWQLDGGAVLAARSSAHAGCIAPQGVPLDLQPATHIPSAAAGGGGRRRRAAGHEGQTDRR